MATSKRPPDAELESSKPARSTEPDGAWNDRRAAVMVGLALLLPAWILRGALVAPGTSLAGRGLVADFAAAALVAPLVLLLRRRQRWLGVVAVGLWVLVQVANYQHVRALGGLASLGNAHFLLDPAFVLGSAVRWSEPLLMVVVLAAAVVGVGWGRPPSARGAGRWSLVSVVAGSLCAGVLALWPPDPAVDDWRQHNVVLENVRQLVSRAGDRPTVAADDSAAFWRPPDLAGTPRVTLGHAGTNVLLIMLEGLSGAHLPAAAAAHGTYPTSSLERFGELAADHLLYTTFVAEQRQTNRGEYAILCGDLPKLRTETAKMEEVVAGQRRPVCLPHLLARAGYRSIYLQSAPLTFQRKDRFLPIAGFDDMLGRESFEEAYLLTPWGVDDRTLFERAADLVVELERAPEPWFLALLNVGTHHPYAVPGSHRGNLEADFAQALAYLDDAVTDFLVRLGEIGVDRETLIVVTSDESAGGGLEAAGIRRFLIQAWAPLVVLTPERDRMTISEIYGQSDLALSILDYLGLATDSSPVTGRSIFRRYQTPRTVPFANTFLRRTGALFDHRELYICREDLRRCRAFSVAEGRLFAPGLDPIEVREERVALLRELVEHDRAAGARPIRMGWSVPLIVTPEVAVGRPPQAIFDHRFELPADTRLEVWLEIETRGRGELTLAYALELPAGERQVIETTLSSGDRLSVGYVLRTTDLADLALLLELTEAVGEDLSLRFIRGLATADPLAGGWQEADGWTFRLLECELSRAGRIVDARSLWRHEQGRPIAPDR